ncbi:methyl-accepting chemotaxis protein [Paenibacillus endophyticus]|uniref:Methyl-accepting chemotaxis protein n=1 Tax=Paenibacillus endophyticus TaxID=1294268 RepID=A0A7W5C9A3_9BACL|nr:methyl-accepting chemotaxis protein [Paenibacillus endophyticus]MBB3153352.1 methyl-accepting chemotaxis protein [Paenibacillus endophyticus]
MLLLNKLKNIRSIKPTIRLKLMLLCLSLLLIPSILVSVFSYQSAVDALNTGGQKQLKNSVRSTISLIALLDTQVKTGAVDRKAAEEFVKISMLGVKDEAGKRPVNKSIDLGENGYPFAFDSEMVVIAHPSSEGGSLAGMANSGGELVLDNEKGIPVTDAFLAKAEAGGGFVYYDWTLPDTEDEIASKIVYIEKDPYWGWNVAAGTYMNDFNQGAQQIIKVTIITLLIMIVIGIAATILFTVRMTKPIKQVSALAKEVAQGNLRIEPIVCHYRDETGVLANSFNEMVVQLRTLVHEVGHSVDQVASSSEELMASGEQTSQASEHIAYTIQKVADGAEKQSTSAEQSYQVIHDMSASVQQIAVSTEQASHSARRTSIQATEGSDALQQAVVQMESIQRSFDGLAEAVRGLGVRSTEIVKMVQVISDISSQTNLLALNASIEAARAGEHGKGFAVVAGEVRKLAEQTKESSEHITSIVKAVGAETERVVIAMGDAGSVVSSGILAVEGAGSMFGTIRDEVIQVAQQIDEVSQAASGIAAGTERVMLTIKEVVDVAIEGASGTQTVAAAAQQQTASMEEIAASSAMLANMAERLQNEISKFKV